MSSAARFAIVAVFVLVLVPVLRAAHGEDTTHPARAEEPGRPAAAEPGLVACLDQRARRAEAGKFVPLAAAMRVAAARTASSMC
jgi:hypothetical protein